MVPFWQFQLPLNLPKRSPPRIAARVALPAFVMLYSRFLQLGLRCKDASRESVVGALIVNVCLWLLKVRGRATKVCPDLRVVRLEGAAQLVVLRMRGAVLAVSAAAESVKAFTPSHFNQSRAARICHFLLAVSCILICGAKMRAGKNRASAPPSLMHLIIE